MPNHCENYLEISGKPKLINKLMKQVEITASEATQEHSQTIFSCHKVIPQPILKGQEWYAWRISHWGSKWDIYDIFVIGDWESGSWSMSFESAWSPISPVVAELAKQYPNLNFFYKYHESGNDFWGKEYYEGGELKTIEEGNLSNATCEVLDDFYGGEHHWCRSCGEPYACNSNDELCDTCLEEELKIQEQLLEETDNKDESNLVSAGTND